MSIFVKHTFPADNDSAFIELNAKFLNYPVEEFSDHRLFHGLRNAYWYYKDHWVSSQSAIAEDGNPGKLSFLTFLEFSHKMISINPQFHGYSERLKELLDNEEKNDRKIPRSKTILFDKDCKHFLVIQPYKSDYFVLPGGKVNEGESMLACAVRETREEIGYDCGGILSENKVYKCENSKYFYGKGVPSDGSVEFSTQSFKEVETVLWVKVDSLNPQATTAKGKNNRTIQLKLPIKVIEAIISIAKELKSTK